MDSAFSWISEIVAWFGQFFPRVEIIPTTHGAVKFVRGNQVKALAPGWHIYWPFTTKFCTYPIARQTVNLRSQTLVTKDERTIVVGGMIVYEINNIKAILAETYDPDDTIEDVTTGVINYVISQKTWAELRQTRKLDSELKARVGRELEKYGVKVLKTTLTDLAPCKVIKLVGLEKEQRFG